MVIIMRTTTAVLSYEMDMQALCSKWTYLSLKLEKLSNKELELSQEKG